jgi:hypothetical protein
LNTQSAKLGYSAPIILESNEKKEKTELNNSHSIYNQLIDQNFISNKNNDTSNNINLISNKSNINDKNGSKLCRLTSAKLKSVSNRFINLDKSYKEQNSFIGEFLLLDVEKNNSMIENNHEINNKDENINYNLNDQKFLQILNKCNIFYLS